MRHSLNRAEHPRVGECSLTHLSNINYRDIDPEIQSFNFMALPPDIAPSSMVPPQFVEIEHLGNTVRLRL